MRFVLLLATLFAVQGCAIFPRWLAMPDTRETTVALLTGGLGHPMNGIARHPWFAIRKKGETTWHVYEVGGGGDEEDPFTKHTPYVEPMLHKVWRGDEAEAAATCIEREGPKIRSYIESHYIFYPGPNSNTFGDRVLRACKLSASLPSTSVGKDWRGIIGAGVTSERTGLQIETPLVGFKIGLKEGIEVHIIGLSFGVDLWPPAIIVPVSYGRIGFADR